MGAVHDFFAGMMSIRNGGANMPDITGRYLGKGMKGVMNVIVAFLLLAVGVSFVTGPSDLIAVPPEIEQQIFPSQLLQAMGVSQCIFQYNIGNPVAHIHLTVGEEVVHNELSVMSFFV